MYSLFQVIFPLTNESKGFLYSKFADGSYGTLLKEPDKYNGMIGELLDQKADLAIAPLTVKEDRMKVVDFTQPFMTTGARVFLLHYETNSHYSS